MALDNERHFDWNSWPVPKGIKDINERDRVCDFDSYRGRFNDRRDTAPQPIFSLVLLKSLLALESPRVLDVGCGHGIGAKEEYQSMLSGLSGEYWGVEPDPDVPIDSRVVQNVQRCLIEAADLPAGYFDVVFAMFVVEHVEDPAGFLNAVAKCLKPGGKLIFLTSNGSAFFTVVTKWLKNLGLEEFVHNVLRRSQQNEVEHYRVYYRMNKPGQIAEAARRAGLGEPEFAYFQFDGTQGYFPGPFRLLYRVLMGVRRLRNNPKCLDNLICRITKPL